MEMDKAALEAEGIELLKTVEHTDGKPITLSRYGYRVMEIGGKNYLVAATLDELASQLALYEDRDIEIIRAELANTSLPGCHSNGDRGAGNCYPVNGCRRCGEEAIGNGYYRCFCR
jgi:hypothetical protein